MGIPLDSKLYAVSKKHVNKIYGTTTSAYRSMAIVKEYKKRGGKYVSKKNDSGVTKWLKEKWIVVMDYLNGKTTACGTIKRRKHACRPSIRVNPSTPVTIQEFIQLHGRKKTKRLASSKEKGSEQVRIDWKKATVTTT